MKRPFLIFILTLIDFFGMSHAKLAVSDELSKNLKTCLDGKFSSKCMKPTTKLLTIIFITFLSSPSWSETLTMNDLVKRNDLYYKKFTNVPFSGEIVGRETGKIKDGNRTGSWEEYHETGQLKSQKNYKDGKEEGLWEIYDENGQLFRKKNFKDGELLE